MAVVNDQDRIDKTECFAGLSEKKCNTLITKIVVNVVFIRKAKM